MSSKRTWCLLALAIVTPRVWAVPHVFVSAQFADVPAAVVLEVSGSLATNVASILGYAYPRVRMEYWRADGKTVWVLEGRAKKGRILAGFVVADGRIAHSDVLEYGESRGREIRSRRFLRQFDGASMGDSRELDRRVDAITGATISGNAMKNLARLALFLDGYANGTAISGIAVD